MNLGDDDFMLFGLPRRQAQDAAAIDARRRDLQAAAHPDRHAAAGAGAERVAMQWAVRINEAHARLRDPLTRAAYLCELRGVPVDAERNTAMPPAFLQQQMAWREALDDAGDAAAVEELDAAVAEQERLLFADIEHKLDAEADAGSAAERVRELMFVRRFRADIRARLDR